MRNRKRPEHDEHVGRDAHQEHDHIGGYAAEEQVDRVKARRRDPFQLLGRMMDRVIAPHSFAVEQAVRPIKDNVLADKKNTHLHEQR